MVANEHVEPAVGEGASEQPSYTRAVAAPLGPAEPWLAQGPILDGKFRIGEVIGRGGMGVVVAAHHLDLDEPVALKFLLPYAAESATGIERLLREARALARMKSQHVTRILDIVRSSEVPYIVMERLQGVELASLLQSRGPFDIAEAVRWIIEVTEPLEEAHARGIVHRDLKPQNIFLASTPSGGTIVKLLDFGISRAAGNDSDLTRANEVLGTPHFMAPEQFLDPRTSDARADIYSLGACLFCLIAGRPPFMGGDLLQLASQVVLDAPPPLGDSRADVPPELTAVVERCLAKTPAERFASAREVREALAPFVAARAMPATSAALVRHLRDETIVAMQEGRLAERALDSVEAHVAGCDECRALIATAAPETSEAFEDDATILTDDGPTHLARSSPAAEWQVTQRVSSPAFGGLGSSVPPVASTLPPAAPEPCGAPTARATERWPRLVAGEPLASLPSTPATSRRGAAWGVGLAALVVLVGGLGLFGASRQSRSSPATPSLAPTEVLTETIPPAPPPTPAPTVLAPPPPSASVTSAPSARPTPPRPWRRWVGVGRTPAIPSSRNALDEIPDQRR